MNEMIVFAGFAGLITLCSIMVVTLSNPVSAAIFLVLDLFLLGGVYAFQGADFVAAIQIIIYTGAILVLFLFVIMILNLDPKKLLAEQRFRWGEKVLVLAIGVSFLFIAVKMMNLSSSNELVSNHVIADNTQEAALLLFRNYVWPFEIVSLLILVAIIGAISVARKNKEK